jgi:predicted nucleotidyltransferase
MIPLIDRHRDDLKGLCQRHHVKTLELIGSATDGTFDPGRSDLDFLLEFLPEAAGRPFAGYFDLKDDLERLFGRKVDLLMPRAIRNRYLLEAINRQRTPVYAA